MTWAFLMSVIRVKESNIWNVGEPVMERVSTKQGSWDSNNWNSKQCELLLCACYWVSLITVSVYSGFSGLVFMTILQPSLWRETCSPQTYSEWQTKEKEANALNPKSALPALNSYLEGSRHHQSTLWWRGHRKSYLAAGCHLPGRYFSLTYPSSTNRE